jgi:hypothetical protein
MLLPRAVLEVERKKSFGLTRRNTQISAVMDKFETQFEDTTRTPPLALLLQAHPKKMSTDSCHKSPTKLVSNSTKRWLVQLRQRTSKPLAILPKSRKITWVRD